MRSRVQAAEMVFLRSGLTLLDKVKSKDIRESLNIESLLLRLERSQLRWYGQWTLDTNALGKNSQKTLLFKLGGLDRGGGVPDHDTNPPPRPPPFSKLPTPTSLHPFRVKSPLRQIVLVSRRLRVKLSCTH